MTDQLARNPFYHRQAVSNLEHFFGRGEILRQITEMIRGGQSCALVGERRIGKSSLLACLADPRGRSPWLEDDPDLLPICLDFLGFRDASASDLWIEILEAAGDLLSQQGFGSSWDVSGAAVAEASFAGVRRAFRNLHRNGRRVVLLCDEFELAVENPRLDESFFGALRSLAGSVGVAFVTASRLSLLELDQYRDEAVRRKVLGSPFFNIFAEFPVGPFESVEVAEFLEGSLQGSHIRFLKADALFLDEVAGRHPYFLQVAAYHLFECLAHAGSSDRTRVFAEAGSRIRRDTANIFRNLWQHSLPVERRALMALVDSATPRLPAKEAEPWLARLELRGLVRRDGGRDQVFSTFFREWLVRNAVNSGGETES